MRCFEFYGSLPSTMRSTWTGRKTRWRISKWHLPWIKQARKQALADDKKNKRKESSVLLKKGRDVVPPATLDLRVRYICTRTLSYAPCQTLWQGMVPAQLRLYCRLRQGFTVRDENRDGRPSPVRVLRIPDGESLRCCARRCACRRYGQPSRC